MCATDKPMRERKRIQEEQENDSDGITSKIATTWYGFWLWASFSS